jgi:catechol 2,3-dioxygenase-like lactoylglutathione lyase family enzyme
MINGAHVVVYSRDAEAGRAFFRDILGFASRDAGHGWLIFGLPTAAPAFHPAEVNDRHELYLMCDGPVLDFPGGAKREIPLDIGGGCGEDSLVICGD